MKHNRFLYGMFIGLMLLGGLILRLYQNFGIALWHDEAFSALLIKYSWPEMMYRIGLDVHPPAYYIILRLWAAGFGDSLVSLRSFSIFFGLATAVAVYGLAKKLFNQRTALWSFVFVLGSGFQIQYASEARMYTFGAFLIVLCVWSLACALDSLAARGFQRRTLVSWLAFGFLAAASALTHYYLLFPVAFLGLYAAYKLWRQYRYNFKFYTPLLLAGAVMALLFLPWLKWFLYQYRQVGAGYWIPGLTWWSIPETLWQMLVGMTIDVSKTSSRFWLLVAALLTLVMLTQVVRHYRDGAYRWLAIGCLAAPFFGSILFALLALLKGESSSVYLVRYFLFASPFYLMLLAAWLASAPSVVWRRFLGGVYLLLTVTIFIYQRHQLNVPSKPGMLAVADVVASQTARGDAVIVGSSFEFFNLRYYLHQICLSSQNSYPICQTAWPKLYSAGQTAVSSLPHYAGTALLTDSDLLSDMSSLSARGQFVWVVWTNAFGGSKPVVPPGWRQEDEYGYADVHPYPGTWVVATKYVVGR